jgi:hypothetical protein
MPGEGETDIQIREALRDGSYPVTDRRNKEVWDDQNYDGETTAVSGLTGTNIN